MDIEYFNKYLNEPLHDYLKRFQCIYNFFLS